MKRERVTRKFNFRSDEAPKKLWRGFYAAEEGGQEWNTGTWSVRLPPQRGETDGIKRSIKTGKDYTLKRNLDVDLDNLRSLAMGRASAGRRTGPTTQIWFGLEEPVDPLIRRSRR